MQQRALDIARCFLAVVDFRQGLFNIELFYERAQDRISVFEVDPRLASRFSDLPMRVIGVDGHAVSVALALGEDAVALPRGTPSAGAAASFVYRALAPHQVARMPTTRAAARSRHETPDGLLLVFPKRGHALARDFEWLGSHRFGIIHLGGRGEADLRERSLDASARIGWHPPYAATGDAPLSEVGPIDAGWSPIVAQNPNTGLKRVNALADGDDQRVLLTGHELVASLHRGSESLWFVGAQGLYQGVRLRFASAGQKAPSFDSDPARYLPRFVGYCANGIV